MDRLHFLHERIEHLQHFRARIPGGGRRQLPHATAFLERARDGRASRNLERQDVILIVLKELLQGSLLARRVMHEAVCQDPQKLEPGIPLLADAEHGLQHVFDRLGRILLELDRHGHEVGTRECRDHPNP